MNKNYQTFGIVLLLVIVVLAIYFSNSFEYFKVNDFKSCVEAGNPVMESYPRKCEHKNVVYVEELDLNNDGVILMKNKETRTYACFGCNDELCIDPAPVMEQVEESLGLYCNKNFEIVSSEGVRHYCEPENRDVDACIKIYSPTCGWFNETIKCVGYPCAHTFNNACEACRDKNVGYITRGECPKG